MIRALVLMLGLLMAACTAATPSGLDRTKAGARADDPLLAPPPVIQTLDDPTPQTPGSPPPQKAPNSTEAARAPDPA